MTVSHSLRISIEGLTGAHVPVLPAAAVLGAVTGELGGVNRIAGAGEAHGHEAHLGGGTAQPVQKQDAHLAAGEADGGVFLALVWAVMTRCSLFLETNLGFRPSGRCSAWDKTERGSK